MEQQNKKKSFKKRLIAGFLIFIIVIAAALGFVSNYLVNYAIAPGGGGGTRQVEGSNDNDDDNPPADTKAADWALSVPHPDAEITGEGGVKLKAATYRQTDHSYTGKWVIVIHGYHSQKYAMNKYAKAYYDKGYNVLMPDLRAHGESEGDYIGMGWLDRMDILKWLDMILAEDRNAEIVLHGVSMGGAAVMMTSGEKLPENVTALIEDCGYTSVWDIFSSELKKRFSLPSFPLMNYATVISDMKAGYSWKNASSLKQLEKCTVPVLFIHGSDDDFVPSGMVYKNYKAAKNCEKKLLVVEGAGHARSVDKEPELYWNTVFGFIQQYD